MEMSDHHLVPRSRGGRDTETICTDCHRQIHALWDNKVLEHELNTVEDILSQQAFQRFLRWIKKQPPGRRWKAKRSRETKKRGRRG
jgi:5-methylcytosine-specific restriction protein A